MANSTKFLKNAAGGHIDTFPMVDQNLVDFTLENVTAGNTIDIFRLPKGARIIACGVTSKVYEATVTHALDLIDTNGTTVLMAAVAHTAVNQDKAAFPAAGYAASDDLAVVRATIAAANATTAKVVYWIQYIIAQNLA